MYKKFFFSLLSVALITVLFSACRVIDASTIPQNPKAPMGNAAFLEKTIEIKKGDKIDLIATTSSPHVIVNGKWDGGTQKPGAEAGAPQINVTVQGNGKATIGPFTTAGTFDIYCNIHQGMNLQVIVK